MAISVIGGGGAVATVNRSAIGNVSVSMPAGYYRVEGGQTIPQHSNGILKTDSSLSSLAIADFIEETTTTPFLVASGGSRPSGVVYINNLWVIAGTNSNPTNFVYTSPDLVTWTARTHNLGTVSIRGFTVANGVACLISGQVSGALSTSTDGINWTLRNMGTGNTSMFAIGYGAGLYVAGGQAGTLSTSPDLVTWTSRSSYFGTNNSIRGVAFGNGRLVITGGGSSTAGNNVAWSTDGINWTTATNSNGYDGPTTRYTNFDSIIFANGKFVMTHGGSSSVQTAFVSSSTDGDNWTPFTFGAGLQSNAMSAIVYVNGLYLAFGNGLEVTANPTLGRAFVAISANANNWIIRDLEKARFYTNTTSFKAATNGASILVSGINDFVLKPANIAITALGA